MTQAFHRIMLSLYIINIKANFKCLIQLAQMDYPVFVQLIQK